MQRGNWIARIRQERTLAQIQSLIFDNFMTDFTKNNISDQEFLSSLRDIEPWGTVKKLTFEAQVNGPPVGEAVNAKFARVETIKKFRLIDQLLDPEDEELTPTMKLKRKVVNEKYIDLINEMY